MAGRVVAHDASASDAENTDSRATCIDLTRYGWNFSVFFYGIIPSNPLAHLRRIRKKRNHANET